MIYSAFFAKRFFSRKTFSFFIAFWMVYVNDIRVYIYIDMYIYICPFYGFVYDLHPLQPCRIDGMSL